MAVKVPDNSELTPFEIAEARLSMHLQASVKDLESEAAQIEIELKNLEDKARLEGWLWASLIEVQEREVRRFETKSKAVFSGMAGLAVTLGIMSREAVSAKWRAADETLPKSVLYPERPENILYQWVAVSSNICPDCLDLHGEVRTYGEWQSVGLPGSGHTVCQSNCKCLLERVGSMHATPPMKLVRGHIDKKTGEVVEGKGVRGGKGRVIALKPSTKTTPMLDLSKGKLLSK